MRVRLKKFNEGLYPSLPDDKEQFDKIKHGEYYYYDIKKERNGKFHAKYFSLLDVVVSNSGYNIDQLLHVMKLKLGHYETVVNTDGQAIYIPKSISFAKMDQDEFEKFYSKTIDIILRDFFKNTPKHRLDAEVSLVLGFA